VSGPPRPPPRPVRFEHAVTVSPADIDELGHVNNVVYLRWVQETATAHWRAAAPAELQAEVVWVVLRHEIDYRQAARPGDSVIAATWVGDATGTRFERFTRFVRESDQAVLAEVRSVWCPINAATGRPRRIDPALHDYFMESPSA
jgi:acyl-CoA thioester hydrolase